MIHSKKFYRLFQLIIILALLASTFAVLPQAVQAGSQKGVLTAKLASQKVTVSGENFNKNHEFVVTGKSGKSSSAKLGYLKSDDSGVLAKTVFTLPDKLKVVKTLTVCVKDTKSNKRTCITTK